MNVKIVPPDNRAGVDGVFKTVTMDMPDINAVTFDGVTAHVEHREHEGEWKAPETLTADEFNAQFSAILEAWKTAPDDAPVRRSVAVEAQPQSPPVDVGAIMARLAELEAKQAATHEMVSDAIVTAAEAGKE